VRAVRTHPICLSDHECRSYHACQHCTCILYARSSVKRIRVHLFTSGTHWGQPLVLARSQWACIQPICMHRQRFSPVERIAPPISTGSKSVVFGRQTLSYRAARALRTHYACPSDHDCRSCHVCQSDCAVRTGMPGLHTKSSKRRATPYGFCFLFVVQPHSCSRVTEQRRARGRFSCMQFGCGEGVFGDSRHESYRSLKRPSTVHTRMLDGRWDRASLFVCQPLQTGPRLRSLRPCSGSRRFVAEQQQPISGSIN
jgi:hypothetical protein